MMTYTWTNTSQTGGALSNVYRLFLLTCKTDTFTHLLHVYLRLNGEVARFLFRRELAWNHKSTRFLYWFQQGMSPFGECVFVPLFQFSTHTFTDTHSHIFTSEI